MGDLFGLYGYSRQITLASDLEKVAKMGFISWNTHLETLGEPQTKATVIGLSFHVGKCLATCTLKESSKFIPPPQKKEQTCSTLGGKICLKY